MKMPFATPSPSRRPSEAGSQAVGSESETPEHPWGMVLGHFATVARHDPRPEVQHISFESCHVNVVPKPDLGSLTLSVTCC